MKSRNAQPQFTPHLFYPIAPNAAWVDRLAAWGARTIQLRIKGATPEVLQREIAESLASAARYGCDVVINDYWREAIALKAAWVHLGQEDLRDADLAALRRAGVRFGISTHDEAELWIALSLAPDYVALGPIYETTLKAMRFGPQGLERIGEWREKIAGACPLVAIGGLTLERADAVRNAGADKLSVVSDIVAHPDPQARVAAWLKWAEGVAD